MKTENKNIFLCSATELKSTKNLAICGMLAALGVVLKFVASIDIGQFIRIGFSGIPNRVVDCLFGPVTGGIFGAVLDIIKYFVNPNGPFNPLITLNVVLADIIYGLFLYKKPIKLWRFFAAGAIVKVVCNLIIMTTILATMYGSAFNAIIVPRAIKQLVMWPIDAFIEYGAMIAVTKALASAGMYKKPAAKTV